MLLDVEEIQAPSVRSAVLAAPAASSPGALLYVLVDVGDGAVYGPFRSWSIATVS